MRRLWRIATALGFPHPRLMVEPLTSPEVTELLAYYGAEPFGEQRADLRAGIIASTVANFAGRVSSTPAKASQFMPFSGEVKPPEEDPTALAERIKNFFRGFKRARS